MAAIKITVERVDPGALANGSFPIREVTDKLPISAIVLDSDATGISVSTLKKLLSLAKEGELETAITDIETGDDLTNVIDTAYTETA